MQCIARRFNIGSRSDLSQNNSVTYCGKELSVNHEKAICLTMREKSINFPSMNWGPEDFKIEKNSSCKGRKECDGANSSEDTVEVPTEAGIARFRKIRGIVRYISSLRADISYLASLLNVGNEKNLRRSEEHVIEGIRLRLRDQPNMGMIFPYVPSLIDRNPSVHIIGICDGSVRVKSHTTKYTLNEKNNDTGRAAGIIMVCVARDNEEERESSNPFLNDLSSDIKAIVHCLDINSTCVRDTRNSSYFVESEAMVSTLNRGLALKEDLLSMNFSVLSFTILSDAESLLGRLALGKIGVSLTDSIIYNNLKSIKCAFDSNACGVAFVADTSNLSDLLTKYSSFQSDKFKLLNDFMTTGLVVIPREARRGRFISARIGKSQ